MPLPKISVVIRNKNQADALLFLLKNLNERYKEDIDEIIVIDNLSTDNSIAISEKFNARVISIDKFSYGGSANLAAQSARNNIIVIFSAHAYPISWDFFKLIKQKFNDNSKLAGLRCLHNDSDYKTYINKISAKEDPNKAGLMFCGAAFSKSVWEIQNFKNNIRTFEDKEWTKKVLKLGYEIDFTPSIYSYSIKRNKSQLFFRFKNEVVGSYQLWHTKYSFINSLKSLLSSIYKTVVNAFLDLFYALKRFIFMLYFLWNKPEKFK